MKKVILGFLSIIFLGQVAVAQPVSDHAIIPLAVTVQSIMRLNIRSGGNIEFVFNKIADLTTGIANSSAYNTSFDVASSQNWDVQIGTDGPNFVSEEGATFPIARVNLYVDGDIVAGTTVAPTYAAPAVLQEGVLPVTLLLQHVSGGPSNVGTAANNEFVIHWACGNLAPVGGLVGTAAGRYTVNVYLSLTATGTP